MGSIGLLHGDPFAPLNLHVISSNPPSLVPDELLEKEMLKWGQVLGIEEEAQPLRISVEIDGTHFTFEGVRAGDDLWAAAAGVDGIQVALVGIGWPIERIRLTRIPDATPYIEGRDAVLRRLRRGD